MNRLCEFIDLILKFFRIDLFSLTNRLLSHANRMLDDFGNELENTESKIDTTMKKVAKVLHMNNGEFCFCLPGEAPRI